MCSTVAFVFSRYVGKFTLFGVLVLVLHAKTLSSGISFQNANALLFE